jgi:hypothetical protein
MGVVDGYEKPTKTVRIANAAGAEKIAEIQTRLVLARVGDAGLDDPAPQLELDLVAAKMEADKSAKVFKFQSLSGRGMEALKLAHPSKDPALNFDTITFPPALLTVSCIQAGDQDGLSSAEATELWDTYSDGDCQELYAAAWGVSTTAHLRPLSVTDTDSPDLNSVPNLTTAVLEDLRTASS